MKQDQRTDISPSTDEEDRPLVDNSSVISYIGIDKRDGLVSIGKQLLQSPLLFLLLAC